jgi:NTP pyrophosphatase (non-canonical NTP hydrolase)
MTNIYPAQATDDELIHQHIFARGHHCDFAVVFNAQARAIHENAVKHGWWEGGAEARNIGELIALVHSELSEALEAMRQGNPADEHLPQFSSLEVELADVVIRVADLAAGLGLRLGEAIEEKHRYNIKRTYRHGGKEF